MLSSLKTKLFESAKSKKLNVFGFFLVLSFLFLMFSKLSKSYNETIPFYIYYDNVPDQHSIALKHDSIINVRVRAYGFNLVSHNFYKHKFTVDFSRDVRRSGKNYVWDTKNGFSKINELLGSKVELLSIQPESLVFPYEIMTVKTVPIQLLTDITYAPGYDIIDNLVILPDSVKVIGPEKMVEKISRIKTDKLKLKDVDASFNEEIDLLLDKSFEKLRLSKKVVRVKGKVEKFTEGTYEVPVTLVNRPEEIKINYFPKTVLVSYYVSLENYNKIKALDFKVVCDYSEVKNHDGSFFIPQLVEKPELVKSAKVKQQKVEFILIE